MRRLTRLLPKGRFARRLMMLSAGTVAGQLLLVASSPVLTRLFSPAEFGALAVFSAFGSILGGLMALRYDYAIPVARDDEEAAALVAAGLATTAGLSILVAILVAALGPLLAQALGLAGFARLLWLLPVLLLFWGMALALGGWSIRRGTFRANALSNLFQYAGQAAAQIGLGLTGLGSAGLVAGYALGQTARGAIFAITLPGSERRALAAVRPKAVLAAARAHWRYPVFSCSSSLLQSVSQMLPAVLVALLYGPAMAGLFGLGQRIMGLPVRMLGETASAVFLGEIAASGREGLYRLMVRTALQFLLLGVVGMAPLLVAGPQIFALAFGAPWREAGLITQLLVPLYLARFVVVPVSQTLNVYGRQDLHFTSALLNVLALTVSFALGSWLDLAPSVTLLLYSLGSAAAFVFYFAAVWTIARRAATAE